MSSDSEIEGNHWGIAEEDDSPDSDENSTPSPEANGVSPVVGVILMVVVTVVLAAIVGIFLIDLSEETAADEPDDPDITVDKDLSDSSLTVTVSKFPSHYDSVTVTGPERTVKLTHGRQVVFEDVSGTVDVQVIGTRYTSDGVYTPVYMPPDTGETGEKLLYSETISFNDTE